VTGAVSDHQRRTDVLRELLVELDRLAAAQRTIDLRDPEALEKYEREVERLKRRVAELVIKEQRA
jgi:hypothetical protein